MLFSFCVSNYFNKYFNRFYLRCYLFTLIFSAKKHKHISNAELLLCNVMHWLLLKSVEQSVVCWRKWVLVKRHIIVIHALPSIVHCSVLCISWYCALTSIVHLLALCIGYLMLLLCVVCSELCGVTAVLLLHGGQYCVVVCVVCCVYIVYCKN